MLKFVRHFPWKLFPGTLFALFRYNWNVFVVERLTIPFSKRKLPLKINATKRMPFESIGTQAKTMSVQCVSGMRYWMGFYYTVLSWNEHEHSHWHVFARFTQLCGNPVGLPWNRVHAGNMDFVWCQQRRLKHTAFVAMVQSFHIASIQNQQELTLTMSAMEIMEKLFSIDSKW